MLDLNQVRKKKLPNILIIRKYGVNKQVLLYTFIKQYILCATNAG